MIEKWKYYNKIIKISKIIFLKSCIPCRITFFIVFLRWIAVRFIVKKKMRFSSRKNALDHLYIKYFFFFFNFNLLYILTLKKSIMVEPKKK